MYALAAEPLEKFLHVVANGAPHTALELASVLGPILLESALLRGAKQSLGLELPALSLDKFCTARGREISFGRADMIKRSLLAGSHAQEAERLNQEIERLREATGDNCRLVSNGHDFVVLLVWYLRRFGNVPSIRENWVQRALLACIEFENIRDQPMLRSLVRRVHRDAV